MEIEEFPAKIEAGVRGGGGRGGVGGRGEAGLGGGLSNREFVWGWNLQLEDHLFSGVDSFWQIHTFFHL